MCKNDFKRIYLLEIPCKEILNIFSPSKNVSGALLIGSLSVPSKKKSTTKKPNKNNSNFKN